LVKNYNIHYERAVISTCIGKPAILDAVKKKLSPSDFFDDSLKKIYSIMYSFDGPVNHITLLNEVERRYNWSPSKYAEVVNADASCVDIQVMWYADRVKSLSVQRDVLIEIGKASSDASHPDADLKQIAKTLHDYVDSKVVERVDHLPIRNISTQYRTREWWIDGLVPKNACIFIGGAPKSSKTYFIFDLILSLVTGHDFLPDSNGDGFRTTSRADNVLISSTEGDEICTDNRLHRLCWSRGLDITEVRKHMHFIECGFNLVNEKDYKRYIDTIKHVKANLIILDPYIKLVQGIDGNSDMEVQKVLDNIRASIKHGAPGCSLIVVHHIKKTSTEGQYDLRGSGALDGWHDGKISLTRSEKKDEIDTFSMSAYYRDGRGRPKINYQLIDVNLSEYELDRYGIPEYVTGVKLERI
jgi:hypothetical protein